MRLLFKQSCTCTFDRADLLPKPTIHYGVPPDMLHPNPEGAIDIGFICAKCGMAWNGEVIQRDKSLRALRKIVEKSN